VESCVQAAKLTPAGTPVLFAGGSSNAQDAVGMIADVPREHRNQPFKANCKPLTNSNSHKKCIVEARGSQLSAAARSPATILTASIQPN
jgi:hypothetical protein